MSGKNPKEVDGLTPAEDWTDEIISEVARYYYLSAEAEENIRAAARRAFDRARSEVSP